MPNEPTWEERMAERSRLRSAAQEEERRRAIAAPRHADAEYLDEELRRWPKNQRRPRCLACGAFMPIKHYVDTHCKVCGQSYLDLE